MGLTERFKNKIENLDLYKEKNISEEVNVIEENNINDENTKQPIKNILKDNSQETKVENTKVEEQSIVCKFVSNKKEQNTKQSNLLQINPIINANYNICCELETKIIDKIRKTPYWNEYTISAQKKMISAYINNKIKDKYYCDIKNTSDLVQDVLALANSK